MRYRYRHCCGYYHNNCCTFEYCCLCLCKSLTNKRRTPFVLCIYAELMSLLMIGPTYDCRRVYMYMYVQCTYIRVYTTTPVSRVVNQIWQTSSTHMNIIINRSSLLSSRLHSLELPMRMHLDKWGGEGKCHFIRLGKPQRQESTVRNNIKSKTVTETSKTNSIVWLKRSGHWCLYMCVY